MRKQKDDLYKAILFEKLVLKIDENGSTFQAKKVADKMRTKDEENF